MEKPGERDRRRRVKTVPPCNCGLSEDSPRNVNVTSLTGCFMVITVNERGTSPTNFEP